jgi:hypothetical protein
MYFLTIFGRAALARRAYISIADGATIGKITHHPPTLIRVEGLTNNFEVLKKS